MELPDPFYDFHGQIAVDLPGARALFSTRRAGNLGLLTGDPAALANRQRLADALEVSFAWRKQVHGAEVHTANEPTDPSAPWIEADGIATRRPGVAPLVLGADCLPIVISDGRGAVAVHAGWHGLAEGVIAAGVEAIAPAGRLAAAIGPAAGPCCYEVGDDLHATFVAYAASRGRNLDLPAIARAQLAAAGVADVFDVGICTICSDPELFFSHRRDGAGTGRQAGIGWLTS